MGATVAEARAGLVAAGVSGEVVVVDNGSTDGSAEVARKAGARVVDESRRGYGAAHRAGITAAKGDVIVMADADCTYNLLEVGRLLAPLKAGADIVVGNRFQGLQAGAMPFLHQHVGTPLITRTIKLITGGTVSDSQSGYRAFWRQSVAQLDLSTSGMEYASEMLLKAGRAGLNVIEVPSGYRPRVGESKLNTFGDGWRHLRMLLVLSPHVTLVLPGVVLLVIGVGLNLLSLLLPSGVPVGELQWLPVFLGPLLMIVGAQMLWLGGIAAYRMGYAPGWLEERLGILAEPRAVDALLMRFTILVAIGLFADAVLAALWLAELSGPALTGPAGLAQAAVIIGFNGIGTVLSADFARDSILS